MFRFSWHHRYLSKLFDVYSPKADLQKLRNIRHSGLQAEIQTETQSKTAKVQLIRASHSPKVKGRQSPIGLSKIICFGKRGLVTAQNPSAY
jgi:hypothetical protein